MLNRLVVAVLLCSAPAALAAVPAEGEGTITFLGGIRTVLPTNADYLHDVGATHQNLLPAGIASFGYQFDKELHFKLEGGWYPDVYHIAGGDLTVTSIPILLGLDTVLFSGDRFSFYAGGGIGYLLNTGKRPGMSNEANSTAVYVGLGFRYQLGGIVALVMEDRYIYATAAVDGLDPNRSLNVGGNLLLGGLMFHFHEADDHPQHP
jgi:hypothetical protein